MPPRRRLTRVSNGIRPPRPPATGVRPPTEHAEPGRDRKYVRQRRQRVAQKNTKTCMPQNPAAPEPERASTCPCPRDAVHQLRSRRARKHRRCVGPLSSFCPESYEARSEGAVGRAPWEMSPPRRAVGRPLPAACLPLRAADRSPKAAHRPLRVSDYRIMAADHPLRAAHRPGRPTSGSATLPPDPATLPPLPPSPRPPPGPSENG